MANPSDVTTLVVNYRTTDLLRACVESFLLQCGETPLLLIDNGSYDESRDYIQAVARTHDHVDCLLNDRNCYHGPALDQGIRWTCTPYVFTMDSDCRVLRSGFLEMMRSVMQESGSYAVGRVQYKNPLGYACTARTPGSIRYIDPAGMLLKRDIYLTLPPFGHHGAPCLRNMRAARRRGYALTAFALDPYVEHRGRGTCSRYGYGLGMRAKIDHMLNQVFRVLLPHTEADDAADLSTQVVIGKRDAS